MGTPAFAVPPLEQLLQEGYKVVGVCTQPDRPAGRGRAVVASAIKVYASQHGLAVFQPASLRDPGIHRDLVSLAPDIIVIAAYGRILPMEVLNLTKWGCVNIHPSLLPLHRGPSPVVATLIEGDKVAGVTVMALDEGMDSGPIIAQAEEPIQPEDTAGTLTDRLFQRGAQLLVRTLPLYVQGEIVSVDQNEAQATYTQKVTKGDGVIDWDLPAVNIWRQVRAYWHWPGSYTRWRGRHLKVVDVTMPFGADGGAWIRSPLALPGEVVLAENGSKETVGVVTGEGVLGLSRLQLEGKKEVSAREFLLGHEGFMGATLPS